MKQKPFTLGCCPSRPITHTLSSGLASWPPSVPENPEKIPELWHLIKETPGVTGFIGSRSTPVPLEDSEVDAIVKEIRGERERPRPKVLYETGERVKVIDGPFTNFLGNIDEINEERGRLKILIEIFERLTSVEVEFWQVEKV